MVRVVCERVCVCVYRWAANTITHSHTLYPSCMNMCVLFSVLCILRFLRVCVFVVCVMCCILCVVCCVVRANLLQVNVTASHCEGCIHSEFNFGCVGVCCVACSF